MHLDDFFFVTIVFLFLTSLSDWAILFPRACLKIRDRASVESECMPVGGFTSARRTHPHSSSRFGTLDVLAVFFKRALRQAPRRRWRCEVLTSPQDWAILDSYWTRINLDNADLIGADLEGTIVTGEQLAQAR